MALTTLDPNTALIVIDLQKGIAATPGMLHPMEDVVGNAAALVEAFHAHALPVVLVAVNGSAPGRTEQHRGAPGERPADYADLLPELNARPEDLRVTKQTPGAFARTGLEQMLKDRGVTQVVIAGVSTSNGAESTARQAYELGFHVTLAVDAMTDRSAENHDWSLTRIFPRIGESGATREIIELLERTRT
jgi:nicotinamidase-related amidase